MKLNLAYLLNPFNTEEFFEHYWQEKAINIPANNPEKFDLIFNWQKLNYLLNYQRLSYPDDIRFAKDGETLSYKSPRHWLKQLQQGATLIINHIHELEPSLAELASNLRYDMGHHTQINTYCTPQDNQGFDCHYDTHEVLILQIAGEKQWFVLPETIKNPISGQRHDNELPPDDLPYLKTILKEGDVLYIPRGHWHYAVSTGESPSLHLTVGITCDTGLDWLKWMEKKLKESPLWRENLPLLPQGDSKLFQEKLNQLCLELVNELQDPIWQEEYTQEILGQQKPSAPHQLPQQLGCDLYNQGLETKLWRPPHLYYKLVKVNNDHLRVKIGTKQLDLKGDNLEFVWWALQQTKFSLLDLAEVAPDVDWDQVIEPFLTKLVMEGIYFIE